MSPWRASAVTAAAEENSESFPVQRALTCSREPNTSEALDMGSTVVRC